MSPETANWVSRGHQGPSGVSSRVREGLQRRAGGLGFAGRTGRNFKQEHRDVVAELASGMCPQPVEKLVRRLFKIGTPEDVKAVFEPEVPARPVTCLQQSVGVEDQPVARAYRVSR